MPTPLTLADLQWFDSAFRGWDSHLVDPWSKTPPYDWTATEISRDPGVYAFVLTNAVPNLTKIYYMGKGHAGGLYGRLKGKLRKDYNDTRKGKNVRATLKDGTVRYSYPYLNIYPKQGLNTKLYFKAIDREDIAEQVLLAAYFQRYGISPCANQTTEEVYTDPAINELLSDLAARLLVPL